jgi:hypothetical protein
MPTAAFTAPSTILALFQVLTDEWTTLGLNKGDLVAVAQPVTEGALIAATVNGSLRMGFLFSSVAGSDWLVSPCCLIQITKDTAFIPLGVATPLKAYFEENARL